MKTSIDHVACYRQPHMGGEDFRGDKVVISYKNVKQIVPETPAQNKIAISNANIDILESQNSNVSQVVIECDDKVHSQTTRENKIVEINVIYPSLEQKGNDEPTTKNDSYNDNLHMTPILTKQETPIISKHICNTPEPSFIENNAHISNELNDFGQTTNDSEENYIDRQLTDLIALRTKYPSNPLLGYLNVNSLRGSKMDQIRERCGLAPIDILCLDESKLSYDFPDAQFHIEGYQYPLFRRDRVSNQRIKQMIV